LSSLHFAANELAAALARGVRQCVLIGSRSLAREVVENCGDQELHVFAVDEEQATDSAGTFVPTEFACEALSTALQKSDFDKRKASLFVWLGGAGYRTVDAALASFAFIASLPKGSGIVFDYAAERTTPPSLSRTAMDALASSITLAGGKIKYLIQPQAVTALLDGLGFQKIVDLAQEGFPGGAGHLVSAVI